MKRKIEILIILVIMIVGIPHGISQILSDPLQNNYNQNSNFIRVDTLFWVLVKDSSARKPLNNIGFTCNSELNALLCHYNVTKYEQALPWVSSGTLCNLYEIECHNNIDSLINDIKINFPEMYSGIKRLDYEVVSLYNPVDYMWYLTNQDTSSNWLWHLKKIQADLAWNITLGDTCVKTAIIDTDFDITHPDLNGKIFPEFDPYDSVAFTCNVVSNHGTTVAGFVAGETTESGSVSNGQLASIGFNTKMIGYRAWRGNYIQRAHHASFVMNANIITSSAGGWTRCPDESGIDSLIVKEILDNGTTIIMPAGNGVHGTHNECNDIDSLHHTAFFPLNPYYDERIIIVSSTGKDDKHLFTESPAETHSHYPSVDLCAPGYLTMSSMPTQCGNNQWPYYGYCTGTSFAAPIVAGVTALMYSVNPNLTPEWCQDILKNTTDPIIDATNFPNGVGTGRVNAYNAVSIAQQSYSPTLDLYIKDRLEDFGNEIYPYDWQKTRDKSPDIWVRNQADGFIHQKHQEPEYNSNNPVYVYVKVHNKSGATATENENLSLYWTKASTWTSWPQNWDGTDPDIGNIIGSVNLENLSPGRDTIIEFEWQILDPYIHQNWATCLLARIENSQIDTITIHPNRIDDDVYFNNNIAMRNVTITDILPNFTYSDWENNVVFPHGHFLYVGNALPEPCTFDISFTAPTEIDSLSIISQAEVKIIFDDDGWDIFADQLAAHSGVRIIKDKEILMLDNHVELSEIEFPANLRVPIYVGFSFLVQKGTDSAQFQYDVTQRLSSDGTPLGGVYFTINRYPRPPFRANAGSDINDCPYGVDILLMSDLIDELALYNWYDENNTLIQTGTSLWVRPNHTQTYKLEVIALSDGYKDYDDVTITMEDLHGIENIYPSPATNQFTIKYNADNVNSVNLIISNFLGRIYSRKILNKDQKQSIIDLSNYPMGSYTISLECDGIIVDTKTIVIY